MKKFLLSMTALFMCGGFVASADDVVLNVKDATDIVGTDVAEKPADGTSNGQARHIQPLESLKVGDWSFTFSQGANKSNAPAYYYPMSTSTNGKMSVRLYKDNTVTITAPAGVKFNKIVSVPDNGTTKTEIYSGEAVDTYTLTATATIRINELTITTGEGAAPVDPTPAGDVNIVKTTELVEGQVAFVFDRGVVSTFAESASYGYWMATAATLAEEMSTTKESIFTIAKTDAGYTITDAYGRIMGWDGSHWSFNAYASASEGNSLWDITMVDGKVKIVNKATNAGNEVYLCGKTYGSDYEMCPTDRADQTLPFLYKVKSTSGVAEIEAEAAGEAVYYNLQGVKVAEPENGLYIKVQGNKATKVLVRK